ncbi:Tetratricopeptide repeat protein 29 [Symbiodinium microadriaticum]|uniref:Tetratricopeptide repeat protein 29 n=1 Tax=Symbiodinium microadriaticum TaxID=2951 RepID=A0A1Q9CDJ0_SYMMI|nr:Tetratricopeptide repeat protein 29 [Symbiodinium microadriaticum]
MAEEAPAELRVLDDEEEAVLLQDKTSQLLHCLPLTADVVELANAASAESAVGDDALQDDGTHKPDSKDDRLIKVKGLDKQQLCIDLLMVGCVQSYVDFFYITHRKAAPKEGANEDEVKDVVIPEETLIFLKETLEQAESARRLRSYLQCYESYNSLAEFFETVPDLKSAMYFYQRCADVAAEVEAWESIAKANLNLGSCEEQGGNWQSAMQYHEKALEIASSADSLPLQIKAASRLSTVCQVLAEQCEKDGRDAEASSLFERCLSSAQRSKDATLEGTACHKLGLSKQTTGNYEQAVELQRQYLEICRIHDDRVGESAARAALAQAYEATGDTQEAIKQLENLLSAHASGLNLGILYNSRGNHEKSVELLEQHFDLARQIGDRKLIDSARVVLGMVRGNGKLKAYINMVNNDLDKLLKWKSKRATLDS